MLITQSEYARRVSLNQSTISRQIRAGVIPTHDGLIDSEEADRARDRNLNQARRGQAARKKGNRSTTSGTHTLPVLTKPVFHTAEERQAVVEALRRIAAPAEVLRFAAVALRAGCSAKQAFIVSCWFTSAALAELEAADLEGFVDPTDQQWRSVLGKGFDFETAESDLERVIGPELVPAA